MKWYVIIHDNTILAIGSGNSCDPETEITKTEYDHIRSIIRNKPVDPVGYIYKLRADTLEWELVEMPEPEPEPQTDEASPEDYENALSDLGVQFND